MSESEDSGPGLREVAYRLFAAEFDDSEFSYSESDEERAPNYVVTPTGARVNRLFAVGVLTELEQVNEDVLRARIVDPTGAFVVYAGQYQPEALAFLEAATPPLFVAVTGKARTFEPDDGDRVFTSIRPESISEVDAETRDRWVVQAAEQTLDRVGRLASAKRSDLSGDDLRAALVEGGVSESDAAGAALALDYYDTSGDYLQAVRDLSENAARVVAGERDEAGSLSRSPADGTDDPLPMLATMELDAPAASPSETDSEGPAADTATETKAVDEPVTADTSGTEARSDTDDEPSTETAPADSTGPAATTGAASADAATDSTATPSDATPKPDESGATSEADSQTVSPDSDEGSSDSLGDFDDASSTADDAGEFESSGDIGDEDVGDFDTEFELDEDEREEIEEEYGTDFQSGTEVDEAGEADIETPDPDELAEVEADAAAADEPAGTVTETEATATDTAAEADSGSDDEAAADPVSDEPTAEDVDLEDAVMEVMTDLNDGSGADREAVISEVVETYGADRGAVEDAVQDALMGGRCYEPDDGMLTPI